MFLARLRHIFVERLEPAVLPCEVVGDIGRVGIVGRRLALPVGGEAIIISLGNGLSGCLDTRRAGADSP